MRTGVIAAREEGREEVTGGLTGNRPVYKMVTGRGIARQARGGTEREVVGYGVGRGRTMDEV